jgi:catechol-2,3-dioxygenase
MVAAERFYCDVMGLELIRRDDAPAVFRCGQGVVLIFNPDVTRRPGRGVPVHGTEGQGHIAFAMPLDKLDSWRRHFKKMNVEIEMEVEWEEGGCSLYVRDPAGNSVELAPPTLWGGGWDF